MDVFDFCIRAICNESKKCGVFINKTTCKISNSSSENFDLPTNRLSHLYKFGTFNIVFFKNCFLNSIANCPKKEKIIETICSAKWISSLSVGPGTDIIGLLLALKEIGKTLNETLSFKIINKYGAWRNTLNALTSVEGTNIPIFRNFKLLQCDYLNSISAKAINYLRGADVILMNHAFTSPKTQTYAILNTLKMVVDVLKQDALIIIIDTATHLSFFEALASSGAFIFGPTEMQTTNIPYCKDVVQLIGETPVIAGKAYFGVWLKTTVSENPNLDTTSFVTVVPASKKTVCEISSANNSNESTSSEEITYKKHSVEKKLVHNPSDIKTHNCFPDHKKNTKSIGCDSFTIKNQVDACTMVTDSEIQSFQGVQNSKDISQLLKSVNSLVTKVEEFFSSQMISEQVDHFPCNYHGHYCKSLCTHICNCRRNYSSCLHASSNGCTSRHNCHCTKNKNDTICNHNSAMYDN